MFYVLFIAVNNASLSAIDLFDNEYTFVQNPWLIILVTI